MKRSDQRSLLREILTGDDLTDFRRASLEDGLPAVRRHRQRRLGLRISALASLPIFLALAIVLQRAPQSTSRQAGSPGARAVPTALRADTTRVKFITDEELFALFPNRPMALIGKPGKQQLVFLDSATR